MYPDDDEDAREFRPLTAREFQTRPPKPPKEGKAGDGEPPRGRRIVHADDDDEKAERKRPA